MGIMCVSFLLCPSPEDTHLFTVLYSYDDDFLGGFSHRAVSWFCRGRIIASAYTLTASGVLNLIF